MTTASTWRRRRHAESGRTIVDLGVSVDSPARPGAGEFTRLVNTCGVGVVMQLADG
jgi:hypothetical protein